MDKGDVHSYLKVSQIHQFDESLLGEVHIYKFSGSTSNR